MSRSDEGPVLSRPSTAEPPTDAISLFDHHLRYLSDSYLAFFQERKRLEETYVDGLRKLYRKVGETDKMLDHPSRVDMTTTRAAWNEVRDNLAREMETRAAFLGALTADVINPLMTVRETQDRIRKRIKEDLKEAVNAHSDYAENILPKLRLKYIKKCQEAEDYKAALAMLSSTTSASSNFHSDPPAGFSAPLPNLNLKGPNSKGYPSLSPRPFVTTPQPPRPLDRRPSTSGSSSHARTQSTANSLQDAFHSGKRQLNQLMTFLDKGGNTRELAGRSDNALRSVRAKRDAEEADKEYRKGVHWLETLRLRRIKILESGYKSLDSFIRENAETVKSILVKYTDNMIATAMTQAQICGHGSEAIAKIDSETDVSIIERKVPRLLAVATPQPVLYQNYNVGECKDLIFGVSLVDYATARNLPEGEVPKIVTMCVREIEKRGLDAEGIYRVSGRHAAVQELQHQIERNEASFAFEPSIDDIYAVASLLKLYLRELPEPLFRFPLSERIHHSEELKQHREHDFQLLRGKIRRLPTIHQYTLKVIVEHLALVASHSQKNKMDAKNLAIVFGAVIFGEDEMPKSGDLLNVQSWKDTLAEDLINNASILFQSIGSPPMSTVPIVESAPPVSYGSQYAKLGRGGPPPSTFRGPRITRSPSLPPRPSPVFSPIALQPEDFSPQLPPHPPSSIHPSLRAGPMSSMPVRRSLPVQARSVQPPDDSQGGYFGPQPMSRSVSRDSKRTTRATLAPREMPPDIPPRSPKRKLTPRTTPRLPPRPLTPSIQVLDQGLIPSGPGTPVVVESVPDPAAGEAAQVLEVVTDSGDKDAPSSPFTPSTIEGGLSPISPSGLLAPPISPAISDRGLSDSASSATSMERAASTGSSPSHSRQSSSD
ncbi:RhoGAP-domain-containing protein [Wolfiporia cocos MD-104 SS10]|uniref:RhoGAP-domain-containing protein n=1 Tax=Wolfiporia cocos (strain MD-104) TaxID=742152 RepID=A0A2H3J0J2_WOLCO|nr:RhoGAP-domain-containing protein [Wolfiporia cocos MD-104 SS10]